MSDVVQLARIVNLCVLVLTLVVLGARVHTWWCTRWRCLLPAAGTGFIAVMISATTVDALLNDRPGGASTIAITLASLAVLMQACTVGLGRLGGHDHTVGMDIAPPTQARSRH